MARSIDASQLDLVARPHLAAVNLLRITTVGGMRGSDTYLYLDFEDSLTPYGGVADWSSDSDLTLTPLTEALQLEETGTDPKLFSPYG